MEEKKKNQTNSKINNKKTATKNTSSKKSEPKAKTAKAQVKKNSTQSVSKKSNTKVSKNIKKDSGANLKSQSTSPKKVATNHHKKNQETKKNPSVKVKVATKDSEKKLSKTSAVTQPEEAQKVLSQTKTSSLEKKIETKPVSLKEEKKSKPKVELEPKKSKEPKKEEIKEKIDDIAKENAEQLEKTMIFDGSQRKNLEDVVNKLNEDNIILKDKIVKRNPVNRNIIIILSVAIITIIIGCIIYSINYSKNNKTENDNNSILNTDNYNKIETVDGTNNNSNNNSDNDSNDQIKYSNIENISIDDFEVKIAEGENITALISSETCYFCVTFEPIANDVLKEQNQVAYRLNITNMSTEEVNRLRNYYAFTSTPTLLSIKNGAVATATEGALSAEEFTEWLKNNS